MTTEAMKDCTAVCWATRNVCEQTLFRHCLEKGGDHVEADHVRLMMDCIDICQLAADAMVRNSPQHAVFCSACAEICEACAESCSQIEGEEMKKCADECLKCAEYCHDMGAQKKAA
ncbi:MAG: four-helix bundle copper-binding protein [Alphaproteobacteria bacterium]|nr:four-helix bundle copper-binding protein [Alphaproteobacteria bacterium]